MSSYYDEVAHLTGAGVEINWLSPEQVTWWRDFLADDDGYFDLIALAQHVLYVQGSENSMLEANTFVSRADDLAHIWRLGQPEFRREVDVPGPDPVLVEPNDAEAIRQLYGPTAYDALMRPGFLEMHVRLCAVNGTYDLIYATAQLLRVWSNFHMGTRPQDARVWRERASVLYAHFGYSAHPRILEG